jgi:molybdopterin converting factor small subunit
MTIAWQTGMTVMMVRSVITTKLPGIATLLERTSIAVNDQIVSDSFVVPDNAVIALLPPVSGG